MEILFKKIENGDLNYVKHFFTSNKNTEEIILTEGLKTCIEFKHQNVNVQKNIILEDNLNDIFLF
jgi:hypothetical protein